MTNGVVTIKLESGNVNLRYGYTGCMEFEQRLFKNPSTNSGKVFIDLLYSGLYGEAVRNDAEKPEYHEAYDLLDAISEMEDYEAVSLKIWNTYYESKWGKNFKERLEKFTKESKKKEKEDLQSQ